MRECDVLVVGAGPAGSSAALSAARAGCHVLVADRRRAIGRPVQCAGFVPRMLFSRVRVPGDCVVQEIGRMITHLPDGTEVETRSPGYMLDRALFDAELAAQAVEAGAELLTGTACRSRSGREVILGRPGEFRVCPRVIVGADGPMSTVGGWMGRTNSDFIHTVQYTLPLVVASDATEVFFDRRFFGGYGWVFPRGDMANVGLGVRPGTGCRPGPLLDLFVKELASAGLVRNRPVSRTGGLIPVGGPLDTVKEDMLLAGDAAGQTDPVTGGGIPQAVVCGALAGSAAARAAESDDLSVLGEYDRQWRGIYHRSLMNARSKRRFLEENWEMLDTAIKKCWVAFGEYYYE